MNLVRYNHRMNGWMPAILTLCLLLESCHQSQPTDGSFSASSSLPKHLQVPNQGAYTGAFIDFGDTEDDVTLTAIEDFAQLVGKSQAIVASSSYWGEQSFPRRNIDIISRYGAIPLIYWSPWDKPYEQNTPPGRFDLQKILAGQYDTYIDHWADEAKRFGSPVFVAWGLEMNGTWFPWSGYFYNKNNQFGPGIYKKCYRYVVDRVRARGASNILWVFHVNNFSSPPDFWNQIGNYYPGPDYVDWLGMSVYGKQFGKGPWVKFHDAMDYPYQQLCKLDPKLPIMLAEWGVGEYPDSGSKAEWIQEGFSRMSANYPRLKAVVYWHERWQNSDGTYSNLRVNSSPEALQAYRDGLGTSYWIGRPLWK